MHQRCLLIGDLYESLARATLIPLHRACPWNRCSLRIRLTPRNGAPFSGGSRGSPPRDGAANRPRPYGDRSESVRAAPIQTHEHEVRTGPLMQARDHGTKRLLRHCPACINTGPNAGSAVNPYRRLSRLPKRACTSYSAFGTPGAFAQEQGLATAGVDSGFGCEGNGWYQQASRCRDSASLVSRRAELNHIDDFQLGTLVSGMSYRCMKTRMNRHSAAWKASRRSVAFWCIHIRPGLPAHQMQASGEGSQCSGGVRFEARA